MLPITTEIREYQYSPVNVDAYPIRGRKTEYLVILLYIRTIAGICWQAPISSVEGRNAKARKHSQREGTKMPNSLRRLSSRAIYYLDARTLCLVFVTLVQGLLVGEAFD